MRGQVHQVSVGEDVLSLTVFDELFHVLVVLGHDFTSKNERLFVDIIVGVLIETRHVIIVRFEVVFLVYPLGFRAGVYNHVKGLAFKILVSNRVVLEHDVRDIGTDPLVQCEFKNKRRTFLYFVLVELRTPSRVYPLICDFVL